MRSAMFEALHHGPKISTPLGHFKSVGGSRSGHCCNSDVTGEMMSSERSFHAQLRQNRLQ